MPNLPTGPKPGQKTENESYSNLIYGRNALLEALESGSPIDSVFVQTGRIQGTVSKIVAMAKNADIPVKEVTAQKLDGMCPAASHQGVAATLAAAAYSSLEDAFALAESRGVPPFLIVADEIEDPHNLGAIIRTAEACGAHGVVVPKRRSCGLTGVVAKTSAGAVMHLPVIRVPNLASLLEELKEKGLWIFGADMDGQPLYQTDLSGPAAIVVGSEGKGISRVLKEKCDFLVSIPMAGKVSSLNASVAAGIMMYEYVRRTFAK